MTPSDSEYFPQIVPILVQLLKQYVTDPDMEWCVDLCIRPSDLTTVRVGLSRDIGNGVVSVSHLFLPHVYHQLRLEPIDALRLELGTMFSDLDHKAAGNGKPC